MACAIQYPALQKAFPGQTFKPDIASVDSSVSESRKGERAATSHVLQCVNNYHAVSRIAAYYAYNFTGLPLCQLGKVWPLHYSISYFALP